MKQQNSRTGQSSSSASCHLKFGQKNYVVRCISLTQFKSSYQLSLHKNSFPPFHRPIVQCHQNILISPQYKQRWYSVIKNSMCQALQQNTQHCMRCRLYRVLIVPIALPQKTMIICQDFDEMIRVYVVQFSIKLIPSR